MGFKGLVVSPDVVAAIRQFFIGSWLPENFNCRFVTFVLKVDGATHMLFTFVPWHLSNFVFKIILKIIVERQLFYVLSRRDGFY